MPSQFQKIERKWLPKNIALSTFDDILPFFQELHKDEWKKEEDLLKWLDKYSELDAFLNEELAWRYINYTRYTDNEDYSSAYSFYIKEIQPHLIKEGHELTKKLVNHPLFDCLNDDPMINFKLKSKLSLDLFNEKNIPLEVKQNNLSQEYASIIGGLSILHDGNELTMQQASTLLLKPDRSERKVIYEKINDERLKVRSEIESIFHDLIHLRNEVALNCKFLNYRDFKHKSLARFDYSVEEVFSFHNAVEKVALPYLDLLYSDRKEKLSIKELYPYDLQVNIYDNVPLKPFESSDELIDKSIECFNKIDPFFGTTLSVMKEKGFLDLNSRKGKAPGGYNYPLDESGIPFIFMNASGSMRDLTTMVHEGGHAVHSLLTRNLSSNWLKHCPSEVAELASMSMELISMDGWDSFFPNERDLLRAKIDQLEGVLDVLPWIATVDCFQHWIYTHPKASKSERVEEWMKILERFSSSEIQTPPAYESYIKNYWQKQLHIFEVPFYYIEYGIAQLGAIAIWKNYMKNPKTTLDQYKAALELGYTRSIPAIYSTAGIKFSFDEDYVSDLLSFVWDELQLLRTKFYTLDQN